MPEGPGPGTTPDDPRGPTHRPAANPVGGSSAPGGRLPGAMPADSTDPDLRRLGARPASRLADLVSAVFDPLILVSATLVAVGAAATSPAWVGLAWAAAAMAGCALTPEIVLRLLVRAGSVGDRQLVVRAHRHTPMLIATGCIAVTLLLLVVGGAPQALVALVVTILLGLAAMMAVTRVWKASVHADVAATCATVAATYLGPWTVWAGVPIVAAVCWARIRSGRHSPAQVAVGVALGTALTLAVFPRLL